MTRLAIEGGTPAVRSPLPSVYSGLQTIGAEEEAAVLQVLRSGNLFRWGIPDSQVRALEQEFSRRMQVEHALAVSSGTTALMCGLVALGVGPGDEVIVPAYTWIATAAAVVGVGAVPIIAEIDASLTLDPVDVEKKISPRTRVIIPVHMRGAPARMAELQALAKARGLGILEDAAQAAGGSYLGRPLGSIGDVGAFSFQAYKNVSAGEGGMVVTNDGARFLRAVDYHDHGSRPFFSDDHRPAQSNLGLSFRLSEIQGALARVQLGRLDSIVGTMRRHKRRMVEAVRAAGRGILLREPCDEDGDSAVALVWFSFAAERVVAALCAEGVPASRLFDRRTVDHHVYYFWDAILERRTLAGNAGPWSWPVEYHREMCSRSLELLERAVHIDISPRFSDEQVDQICEGLSKVLKVIG